MYIQVCMYIYIIHTHTHVHIYIYIYIYIYTYIYIYIYTYIYIYIYIYIQGSEHTEGGDRCSPTAHRCRILPARGNQARLGIAGRDPSDLAPGWLFVEDYL